MATETEIEKQETITEEKTAEEKLFDKEEKQSKEESEKKEESKNEDSEKEEQKNVSEKKEDKSEEEPKEKEKEEAKEDSEKSEKKIEISKEKLKVPENSQISEEHVEKTVEYAKQQGFSQEQTQALLERDAKLISDQADHQKEMLAAADKTWQETIVADKELGGDNLNQTAILGKSFIDKFGDDELKTRLRETKLGNYPPFVRMVVRAAKKMSPDQLILPGAAGTSPGKKSPAEVLYGDSENK